jgi:hypothetical protein
MTGKPSAFDRIGQILIGLVALFALANGAFMLADPFGWYQTVETVRFTGPSNAHFIRDIGIAYLCSGIVLGFGAVNPPMRWLSIAAGNLWLSLHGVLHVWEAATGICAPDVFWKDAPGVLGPPILVWIALGLFLARQRISPAGVPKGLFVGAVEQMSPGEAEYVREIASAPGHLLEKFKQMMPVTQHRHVAAPDLFHMARIGATLVEDCGPCAMTAAAGALADGVSRDLVNAALASTPPTGELATAFRFGEAIARQSADAFGLGDEIERIFGRAVRLELAVGAATVRVYPSMKRGLGLSRACSLTRLEV